MSGATLDPRTEPPAPDEASVRPVVALPRSGLSPALLAALAVVAAVILFLVLDSRRRTEPAPAVAPRPSDRLAGASPAPPLYIPPEPPPPPAVTVVETPAPAPAPRVVPPPAPRPQPPQMIYMPQPAPPPQPLPQPNPITRAPGGAALVVDTTTAVAGGEGGAAAGGGGPDSVASFGAAAAAPRSRAGVLANRSTTVPQGTLIPAVMETAFDSTRPGFARAIVQKDIRGFDGTKVLIPRGSRLVGEYRSDASPGQNRALVNWTRLVRPDGVTIAIGSPATDTLGRGGVKASVNSHFFERFAGALLQSTIDLGMTLAARSASGPVVVLPNSLSGSALSPITTTQIRPTLKVKAATSISVFVARDLDFTGVERRR
jgi:type IV secretion system protein VirB10